MGSYAEMISGGNEALLKEVPVATSVRQATVVLTDEEIAAGLVQHRTATQVTQKGFIILRPGDPYYLVASPKFRNLFYVVAWRQERWMCSSNDARIVARCIALVQIASASGTAIASRVADALHLVASVKQERQWWRMECCQERAEVLLSGRFLDDPQAMPRWHWSFTDTDALTEVVRDVKAILFSYGAYEPVDEEERGWLAEEEALQGL